MHVSTLVVSQMDAQYEPQSLEDLLDMEPSLPQGLADIIEQVKASPTYTVHEMESLFNLFKTLLEDNTDLED